MCDSYIKSSLRVEMIKNSIKQHFPAKKLMLKNRLPLLTPTLQHVTVNAYIIVCMYYCDLSLSLLFLGVFVFIHLIS